MTTTEKKPAKPSDRWLAIALGLIGLGLLTLGTALFQLTTELSYWRQDGASLIHDIDQVMAKIPTVMAESEKLRVTVADVTAEVAEVRELVPSILTEVREVRLLVPPILEQVEATRIELPAITSTIEQVNANIPMVINEVKQTREALPEVLDRTEKIVAEFGKSSEKAGEDAMHGAMRGIVTAPLKAVENISEKVIPPKK